MKIIMAKIKMERVKMVAQMTTKRYCLIPFLHSFTTR